MFFRLILESLRRERGRKLLAAAAIFLGTTAITAMAALALGIGDNVARELNNTYGANLVVYPKAATVRASVAGMDVAPAAASLLREDDLPKLKTIFWRNNITALSPELSVPVTLLRKVKSKTTAGPSTSLRSGRDDSVVGSSKESRATAGPSTSLRSGRDDSVVERSGRDDSFVGMQVTALGTWFSHPLANAPQDFRTGAPATHPWWKLSGAWPMDGSQQVVLGSALAAKTDLRIGDAIMLNGGHATVTGIVTTGDSVDSQVLTPLAMAQDIAAEPGAVDRVLVTAVTKPEDALARRDPASLSPRDHDRWYCSPYANAIALQINEAVPGASAAQLRAVAQGESTVLGHISGLMLLIGIAALVASVLAVSSAMSAAILERAQEMALMRSMGATKFAVIALLFSEVALLAIVASALGWLCGSLLAHQVAQHLFAHTAAVSPALPPLVVLLGVLVAIAGAAVPVRRTLRLAPALLLHGGR